MGDRVLSELSATLGQSLRQEPPCWEGLTVHFLARAPHLSARQPPPVSFSTCSLYSLSSDLMMMERQNAPAPRPSRPRPAHTASLSKKPHQGPTRLLSLPTQVHHLLSIRQEASLHRWPGPEPQRPPDWGPLSKRGAVAVEGVVPGREQGLQSPKEGRVEKGAIQSCSSC